MSLFSRLVQDAGARMASLGLQSRLERGDQDATDQAQVLRRLLENFSRTDHGRVHRLVPGLAWEDFVKRAPLMAPEDLAPSLLRGEHDGQNLLWPGATKSVLAEVVAPGEKPRRWPCTADSLRLFGENLRLALLAGGLHGIHCTQFNQPALCIGRSCSPSAPKTLLDLLAQGLASGNGLSSLTLPDTAPVPSPSGAGHGLLLLDDPLWLASLFPEPLISTDAGSMLASRPGWTKGINIVVACHGSSCGLGTQARLLLGHEVRVHEIFATPFGVIAARIGDSGSGLRLLTDAGIHYEFLPVEELASGGLDTLSTKTVGVDGLRAGESYVLVVSTPAGLCRLVTGERLRCIATRPAIVQPEGRQDRVLTLGGEPFSEGALFEALARCCENQDWAVVHMHVAPTHPGHAGPPALEWWVELKPGSHQTPTGPLLSGMLDAVLCRQSRAYQARRTTGTLASPVVRLVIPGVFKQWLQSNRLLDPAFRLPRCLPDRRIADALAGLAKFSD